MKTQGSGRVVIPCGSVAEAERVRRALAPDNEGFVVATVRGRDLVLEFPRGALGRLVASVDDALAGVSVALGSGGDDEE